MKYDFFEALSNANQTEHVQTICQNIRRKRLSRGKSLHFVWCLTIAVWTKEKSYLDCLTLSLVFLTVLCYQCHANCFGLVSVRFYLTVLISTYIFFCEKKLNVNIRTIIHTDECSERGKKATFSTFLCWRLTYVVESRNNKLTWFSVCEFLLGLQTASSNSSDFFR